MSNTKEDYVEVDVNRMVKALWKRVWLILMVAIIIGAAAFSCTEKFVTPRYKARTLLYVNNSDFSLGSTKVSISQGDLTAAQSLIETYIVIMESRMTINEVIKESGVDYTYEQLCHMISSASVNSTEIFYVDVVSEDPYEAEKIANTIGRILPNKIASIVEGSSVRIVDYAVIPAAKDSPNSVRNAVIGMMLGILMTSGMIIIATLRDNLVHNTDDISAAYDIPVLAIIPDLSAESKGDEYCKQNTKKHRYERGGRRHAEKKTGASW